LHKLNGSTFFELVDDSDPIVIPTHYLLFSRKLLRVFSRQWLCFGTASASSYKASLSGHALLAYEEMPF
jgi:hypothetical protein